MVSTTEIAEGIEIIEDLPAVYIREYKAAIIADTHLGFEEEMAEKNVLIPPFQLTRILNIIERVVNAVNPELFIIAGDFKHRFNTLGNVERREIAEVLTYLLPRVDEVIVVRGNHDNYLSYMLRRFPFKLVDHIKLGKYLIVHGHKEPPQDVGDWDTVIFGHEHPSITVRDSIGTVGKYPCFLKGKLKNSKTFLTLPASGIYQTGSRVSLRRDDYLSPILKDFAVLEEVVPVIVDEEVGTLELPPLSALADLI